MEKDRTAIRIELVEGERKELPQETPPPVDAQELEVVELEQRITPASIDSIGTFF